MRVAVIGAGVIGVTTAYELAVDGHEVTVFERRGTVASGCSFANAGLVAPGYVAPWAAPGMPAKVARHLFAAHAPVRIAGPLDAATLGWTWRWWRACRPQVYRANRARMHRLAHFSRERLLQLATRLHLDFERAQGFLVLLRSARELAVAEAGVRALAELGVAPVVLDAAACRAIEPGLNPATPLHAGIYSKDDEVGNCREFTHLLRKEAERAGAIFRFNAHVEQIRAGKEPGLRVLQAAHDARDEALRSRDSSDWPTTQPQAGETTEPSFDAIVVCAAVDSRPLLKPHGVHLPLIAVHGYSVTAPLRHDDQHLHLEPRAALMDERYKVAISRLGQRVRVAGSAEIGGDAEHQNERAQATLDMVLDDWFPGVTRRSAAQRWKGARPMLPDGPPVLGPSGAEGIWLNVGHGGSGWALSAGSARLVADALIGRKTPIEIDGLGIERLQGMSGVERIDGAIGRIALLGVAATRRIEAEALAALPPFTLMARAGAAVARLAIALTPHARRIIVFAGPGNNGGDGIEAATRLCGWGKPTTVLRVGVSATLPADASQALARAGEAGVEIRDFDPDEAISGDLPDLAIDALLGIGAARPPEGAIAAAIGRIAELAALGVRVLAIDVPSGLDVDRGQPLGAACVSADDTLALIAPKPGLFTAGGRDHAGRTWCARLDVEPPDGSADAWLVGTSDPSCAGSARRQASHKGSFGDVAVVGGAPGMAGAAWLAARAAHAAGAGRVFVDLVGERAGANEGSTEIDPLRPELMFRRAWAESDPAVLAATTVVCGCGGGDAVRAALPKLLSVAVRLVLDADALNALAVDPSLLALAAARERRGHATIMTPHPLEAARLLGGTAASVQADRLGAARELAARLRSVIVLKGSGTVICAADGTTRINATGNASLASAGTGDVLAGWLGGRWASLAASAFDIATRAVIEHGAAAEPQRPGALRAGDLVERLHRRERGG